MYSLPLEVVIVPLQLHVFAYKRGNREMIQVQVKSGPAVTCTCIGKRATLHHREKAFHH